MFKWCMLLNLRRVDRVLVGCTLQKMNVKFEWNVWKPRNLVGPRPCCPWNAGLWKAHFFKSKQAHPLYKTTFNLQKVVIHQDEKRDRLGNLRCVSLPFFLNNIWNSSTKTFSMDLLYKNIVLYTGSSWETYLFQNKLEDKNACDSKDFSLFV